MYDTCTKELLDLVTTFLSYSEQWLKEGIIDYDTYLMVTRKKKAFLKEIESRGP